MLDDMTIIAHSLDETDIKVYPIGDVHLGAAEHMGKEWGKFLDRVENDDNAYLILVGDILNNSTRGSVGNPFEEKIPPSEQKIIMHDQLYQVKDKILCGITGNHEARSVKDVDQDPLYDVFVMLGIQERYRRHMAFMKLRLRHATYSFCVSHGASRTRTGYFAYALDGVDVLVTGHTHDPSLEMPAKLVMPTKGNTVTTKVMHKVVVPSWLSFGGYGMTKMYQPKATGKPQVIRLHATSRETGGKKISVSNGDLF